MREVMTATSLQVQVRPFVNAAEANHGDIGMVNPKDIVLLVIKFAEPLKLNIFCPSWIGCR